MNGEEKYTSKQIKVQNNRSGNLKFEPKEGYYYQINNGYDLDAAYSEAWWNAQTGDVYFGIDDKSYDSVLKIYLWTFENQVALDVERIAGIGDDDVSGYILSYDAFDPEANANKTYTFIVTNFEAAQISYFPAGTDVTIEAICRDGYEVTRWTSSETRAEMSGTDHNTVHLRLNETSVPRILVYINSVGPVARPTDNELKALLNQQINVSCSADVEHGKTPYDLKMNSIAVRPESVIGNALNDYAYTITIESDGYVTDYDASTGKAHTPASAIEEITLVYVDNAWAVKTGETTVEFTVSCADSTLPEAEHIWVEVYVDGQKFDNAATPLVTLSADQAGLTWDEENLRYTLDLNAGYGTVAFTFNGQNDLYGIQGIQADLVYGEGSDAGYAYVGPNNATEEDFNDYIARNIKGQSTLKIYVNRLYTVKYKVPAGYTVDSSATDGKWFITDVYLETNGVTNPTEEVTFKDNVQWTSTAPLHAWSESFALAQLPAGLSGWYADNSGEVFGTAGGTTQVSAAAPYADGYHVITFNATELGGGTVNPPDGGPTDEDFTELGLTILVKDNQGDIDHGNGYFKPIPGCYTLTKISDTAYTLTPSVAEYAKQYDIQKSLPEGTHTNTTAQSKVGTFTLTWENNKWNADKTSVTIGVKCTAPDEPGIEVLNSLIQVKVKDFAGSNVPVGAIDHSDRVYGLLENTYKAGAIIPNQNEKTYTAALTLTEGQPYAGKFDESHSLPSGTHSVTTSVSKLPTITLTYNPANPSWTANSTGWTIGVKCQPEEGPDDPSIPTPTDADISGLGLKVTVQCVSESVTHDRDGVITNNSITYNVIADETKERYTIGNVTGTSCTVTILPGVYVGRFDTSARETHRLTEDTQERGIPIGLVYENGAWKLASGETETVTFNVTCVPEKPADDQIPTIVDPDPSDNVKAQIRVQCVYDANTHELDTKDYDLWPNTSDITRYEVSEPVKNGDGAWTCTVTFSDEVYVGRYNQEDEIVSAHKLVDESAPIILTWDPETQTWNAPEYLTNPVATFSVTCVPEQPPETTYTLIYDANGGTFADGSKVMEETGLPAGEHTLSDAAPTYGAYIFSGWTLDSSAQNVIYTDGQLPATVTAVTIIQENITVYAVWRESPSVDPVTYHTVTFVNLGSTYATQLVADGHTATQPASPTRSGYTFAGWYLGSSRYNFSAPVTADIELTAHWTEDSGGSNPGSGEDNDCILRFDSNGGTEFDEIDNGDDPFTINPYVDHIPSRSGYRFTGWYRRSDLTNRIEGDLRVTSVVTIYAG